MAGFFVGMSGVKAGSAYELLGDVISIGRSPDNDIVIDDSRISRHHARLEMRGGIFYLADLGSGNGTWVNGIRLTTPVSLKIGDTISLGEGNDFKYNLHPEHDGMMTIIESPRSTASQRLSSQQLPPSGALASQMPAMAPMVIPQKSSAAPWFAMIGVGTVMIFLLILVIIGGGALFFILRGKEGETPTAVNALALATFTPYPTYTLLPPTATPFPTYTMPPPTATAYPTYTIPAPSATPYPTYTIPAPSATPYPTYTPRPAPPAIQPTNAPPPPQPSQAPQPETSQYTITLRNIGYEQWGRPRYAFCGGFDNEDNFNEFEPVRKFTVEVILRNDSNQFITKKWIPSIFAFSGKQPDTCVYEYDDRAISPGEEVGATFYTYVELAEYVSIMTFDVMGTYIQLCISPNNIVTKC